MTPGRPVGRRQTLWHTFSVARKMVEGCNATSAERTGSREFADAIPCLHGVPTGLGSLFEGCPNGCNEICLSTTRSGRAWGAVRTGAMTFDRVQTLST